MEELALTDPVVVPEQVPIGELRVTIQYGPVDTHYVSGPMGLYPTGVIEILNAVHAALAKAR